MALWGHLLLAAILFSCSFAKSAENDSPARKQYEQIVQEHQAAQRKWREAYSEAKTEEERSGLKYPQPEEFAPHLLALAKEHPRDPAAIDALAWITQNSRQGDELDTALRLLLADHAKAEALTNVVPWLQHASSREAEPFLRAVAEKSASDPVKGRALLTLGRILKDQAGYVDVLKTNTDPKRVERYTHRFGKDVSANADAVRNEAESIFETVITKYGGQPDYSGTLGQAAKGELYEMRNLVIGKVAPEIEGKDVDGKAFKLSEYRGKVVVLDFWGHW